MLNLHLPTAFPSFDDWDIDKIQYLLENSEICYDYGDEGYESSGDCRVLCTPHLQKENPLSLCKYCNDRIPMEFSVDEDEWVYVNCKQLGNGIILHSLCFFFYVRDRKVEY